MHKSLSSNVDVSRETIERLESFCELVKKWNPTVNLVSKDSIKDIWSRHIDDSLQLFGLGKDTGSWVDIGSGGGFPGIVVACILAEKNKSREVTLIESDQRKCAFLRTAVRQLSLDTTIIAGRVENVPSLQVSTLSARALAPLSNLVSYADTHLQAGGVCVFPKGARWKKELEDAQVGWIFEHEVVHSKTDHQAAILVIRDLEKRP